MDEMEVFSAVGEEGFARLIAAFYRQVPRDEILGPMYPKHDLAGAEQRLCDYLMNIASAGRKNISRNAGIPACRARHFPFPITQAARDRWMLFMDIALKQAAFPPDAEKYVREFFEGMSTFMINRAEQGAQQ